jgi:XTP/dITP diphosphohydrolase
VLGEASVPVEDAEGFVATAERRARELCRATGLVSVAEASGLVVDVLGERPGLRSDRFAGERATDAENNAALLAALEEFGDADRGAHFRCVLALATPWSPDLVVADGRLDGRIARHAGGSGGFGYEPLFVVEAETERLLSELDEDVRIRLSPQVRAAKTLRDGLAQVLDHVLDATSRILV